MVRKPSRDSISNVSEVAIAGVSIPTSINWAAHMERVTSLS